MPLQNIPFSVELNQSISVGDIVYVVNFINHPSTGLPTTVSDSAPVPVGDIVDISGSTLIVNATWGQGPVIPGSYIMVGKSLEANETSVKGYYADVTLENATREKAELFAISSEIVPSSK